MAPGADDRKPDEAAGMVAGRWRLLRRLGQGGGGEAWLAADTFDGGRVALKRLTAAHRDRLREREAIALERVQHHRLARQITSFQDAEGGVWLVYEHIAGPTLAEVLARRGRLTPYETRRILADLLEALGALHEAGLIHRDVTPANIVLSPERGAVLVDFGAIGFIGSHGPPPERGAAGRTVVGQVVGTLRYMAPEQAMGEAQSVATDFWAVGAITVEMLTGRPMVDTDSVYVAIASVAEGRPIATSGVPAAFRDFVRTCLRQEGPFPETARALAALLPRDLPRTTAPGDDRPDHAPSPPPAGTREAEGGDFFGETDGPPPDAPSRGEARPPAPRAAGGAQGSGGDAGAEGPGGDPFGPAAGDPTPDLPEKALSRSAGPPLVLIALGVGGAVVLVSALALVVAGGLLSGPSPGTPPPLALDRDLLRAAGLLVLGTAVAALGVVLSRRLARRADAARGAIRLEASAAISGRDVRRALEAPLMAEIRAYQALATSASDRVLTMTMVALARDWLDAEDAEDGRRALAMFLDLHEKVSRRLTPWWLDYDRAIARLVGAVSLLGSAVAVIEGVRGLV